jgi:hypothetical protein
VMVSNIPASSRSASANRFSPKPANDTTSGARGGGYRKESAGNRGTDRGIEKNRNPGRITSDNDA